MKLKKIIKKAKAGSGAPSVRVSTILSISAAAVKFLGLTLTSGAEIAKDELTNAFYLAFSDPCGDNASPLRKNTGSSDIHPAFRANCVGPAIEDGLEKGKYHIGAATVIEDEGKKQLWYKMIKAE